MLRYVMCFALTAAMVTLVAGRSATAEDPKGDKKGDKNVHYGKFGTATGNDFTMTDKGGKEHKHTLAADGKVVVDGKDAKLSDLKTGAMIRVTTKEGDEKTATKVETVKGGDKGPGDKGPGDKGTPPSDKKSPPSDK